MAVKVAMPVEIQNLLLTMNDLETLKPFLIKVFDNPKMKQVYGKKSDGAGASSAGAFTAVKSQDPPVPNSISYFCSKMDKLEDKLGQLALFDNRPRRPPFKPTVTPRRGRGGGPGQSNPFRYRGGQRRFQRRPFEPRDFRGNRPRYPPREYGRPRPFQGKGRGRFDKSPNVPRPRVAKKTPNKDEERCHYCQEIGHWARECRRKAADKAKGNQSGRIQSMQDPPLDPSLFPELDDSNPFLDDSGYEPDVGHNNMGHLNILGS